jgi:hypothetical protein
MPGSSIGPSPAARTFTTFSVTSGASFGDAMSRTSSSAWRTSVAELGVRASPRGYAGLDLAIIAALLSGTSGLVDVEPPIDSSGD